MDLGLESFPGVNKNRSKQIVVHVDMDCFYAACERLRRPELRGEPVVVGMGYDEEDPHGAVATASYEARSHGVESAMPIGEALDYLPRRADADPDNTDAPDPMESAYYVPVDMDYYKDVSREVQGVLARHADVLEPVGIDEAYLDVTEITVWNDAVDFAGRLKERVEDRVGVTASVGVAPTKSAAKIASDHDKPDGLVVVEPGDVQDFLQALPVEDVHGVGPVTASELRGKGIATAGDLAETPATELTDNFGDRGRELHRRARGVDPRPVSPPDDPKSLSRERSFGDHLREPEEKQRRVRELADAVVERAESNDALYRTVGIKVVTPPFDVHTREHSLSGPVDDPDLVERVALDLLEEFHGAEVRKLGVRLSNLVFSRREQVTLDAWGNGGGVLRDYGAGLATRLRGWRQLTLQEFR